jgi:hypothetical protein
VSRLPYHAAQFGRSATACGPRRGRPRPTDGNRANHEEPQFAFRPPSTGHLACFERLLPWILVLLIGCAAPPASPPAATALNQDYEHAIREAAVRRPEFSVPLRAISAGQAMVTVATFTEWGVPTTPLPRSTWVSLPEQLQEMCRGKPDSVLAIQQILGLPPASTPSRPDHQWAVVTFTVPRANIFRPCPGGTDIASLRCSASGVAPNLDEFTARFLLNQLWISDRIGFEKPDSGKDMTQDFGYPFTGMGWSYDWDPASPTHIGISEYVVRPGAMVQNASATSPEHFCTGPTARPF